MRDIIIFVGLLLSFLCLFFGNYGVFAWTVLRWVKKPIKKKSKGKIVLVQPKTTVGEKIRCCIPVWQAVEVRKALYGTGGVFTPISIVSIVLITINFVTSFLLPINGYVMLAGHICFYIGFIMAWVVYAIITADCARMYDFGKLTILLNVLLPNIFCFYIKNNIPHIMLDMRKQKTFEESSDTVIKSKPSKR
ncbi:MAG: hypothetical protein NC548_31480 [Lachnospiraceae bacterium]|nr:hypothetical protein [Lachnospiraceae bacterium]